MLTTDDPLTCYTDGAPITYLATSTTGETTVAEEDDDFALINTRNLHSIPRANCLFFN